MTEKLYEKQSYRKECQTLVTECVREGDKVYIKLKETIFFPEEGGQYSDTGTLCFGGRTVHVLRGDLLGSPTEGETDIRYLADGEIEAGTEVLCKLDWDIRFDRMQNHSGEHILSGLLHRNYGYNNTGFHLSDTEPVTVDTDGVLSAEEAEALEREANSVIYANLPITVSYPSAGELKALDYRSKIEIRSALRMITIGDESQTVDVCACCAPHVSSTGSVGILKILSAEKFRGGTRLSILCGRRAYAYINQSLKYLDAASRVFSTRPELLSSIAKKSKEDNLRLKEEAGKLAEELLLKEIRSEAGSNLICTEIALAPDSMKNLYNALTGLREGFVGIFSGNDRDGYRYYAGGRDLDARSLSQRMQEELGAKGGGSPEMVQGKTSAGRKQLEAFFSRINKGA